MPRTQLTAEESQTLILDHAERLFRDIGYSKTTMGDIAEACGFSPSNVHRHFRTKRDINEAIAERILLGKETLALNAARLASDPRDKLKTLLRMLHAGTIDALISEKRVHEMVAVACEERWRAVADYRERVRGHIRAIIEEGAAARGLSYGEIDRAASALFLSCTAILHPLIVAENMEFNPDRTPDVLIDFVVDGVAAQLFRDADVPASLPLDGAG